MSTQQGNRSFITIIIVVLAIGAGAIGYLVSRPKAQAVVLDPNAPPPRPEGHVIGSDTAPVEIVMFADFECPGCGQFATVTEPDVRTRLVATGAARFRFVDFPLRGHPSTMFAHNAAACAGAQQKFWEMHDHIFQRQHEWSEFANRRDMNAPRVLKRYARDLGLNTSEFNACFDSRQLEPQIIANAREGERLGVGGTPTFLIGSRLLPAGAHPYDVIKAVVDTVTIEARKNPKPTRTFGDTAKAGQ
ncbi:MAG TPA: thioredoxin domain-containing protein [Gemmatimonadaceae bacterium]|nr:thioredoxin domain-containing protein [Gemmatimonadaceae bacterium]